MAGHEDKEHYYLTVLMPAKLEVDLAYCQDLRFSRDLSIILNTLFRLTLRTSGIANSRNTTASGPVAGS